MDQFQNFDNPNVAPHLQHLADMTFANLLHEAKKAGVPIPTENWPFDMMDSEIGNRWKACIADFLVALIPKS